MRFKSGIRDQSSYRTGPKISGFARVDRAGGKYGAGAIYGVSAITSGVEALGHGWWVDEYFTRQVAEALIAGRPATESQRGGFKVRYTHPGLSSDGLSRTIGRFHAPEGVASTEGLIVDEKVMGDLHFIESAHDTPDGNLAKHVMDLAETDPDIFGASISFKPDYDAEEHFAEEHRDDKGKFKSPDKRNERNLFHARLSRLKAVDVVGDPAANPDGLFGQSLGHSIDQSIAYVLGDSDERPRQPLFADVVEIDRVRQAVARYRETRSRLEAETETDGSRPLSSLRNELRLAESELQMP